MTDNEAAGSSLEPKRGDRAAIAAVMLGYARAVDERDRGGIAACFDPDVRLDLAPSPETDGRGGIDTVMATVDRIDRFETTMHFMGQPIIVFDGDDEADVDTSAIVFFQDGDRIVVRGVRYRDRFERRSEGWVIARRRHRGDWAGVMAAIGTEFPPSPTPEWPSHAE